MSRAIRHLPLNNLLEFVQRPLRLIKHSCEWTALLIAFALAYARPQGEIGDWQALLAASGVPLAVLDGLWDGRHVVGRMRELLFGGLPRRAPEVGPAPALWVSPLPFGVGFFVPGCAGGSFGVSVPWCGPP